VRRRRPLSRPLSRGSKPSEETAVFESIKLKTIPPPLEHLFPLALLVCHSSASLSQSTPSLMWIGDLISMASTCFQPIAHSTPHRSVVELGFQSSKLPNPSDTSVLGCAARVNLSTMDLPPSMNAVGFKRPWAVGKLLPSARTALSEAGEIFDSDDGDDDDNDDNDLPSVEQILASSKRAKRAKRVVDLTSDDDDDRKGDGGDFTKAS